MRTDISIRSSEDIRENYTKISALTRKTPVAITVDGKEDTVLLSYEDYQEQIERINELEARLTIYSHLALGLTDIKLGRVQPMDAAFKDIRSELENLNREAE